MPITWTEATQADWQQGTLNDVVATFSGLTLRQEYQYVLNRIGRVSTGFIGLRKLVLDSENGYLYVMAYSYPAPIRIAKIRLSDFSVVGSIQLNNDEINSGDMAIDKVNGYLYVATGTSPAKVVRIRLADFTRVDDITLESGENQASCMAVDMTNGYLYVGTNTTPARVVRIRLSDFTRVDSIVLNSGENKAVSMAIDAANGYLYVGMYTAPAKVVRIRLNDFTRIDAITLNSGEDNAESMAIDNVRGYLYVGTYTSPAIVVKIRLSDFTRISALPLNSGENSASGMAIDEYGGYLYVSTYTNPSGIVKIKLNDFTRVEAITLQSNETYSRYLVFDETDGYLYVACGSYHVVKIATKSGAYLPSGSRISPALDLSPAGIAVSSKIAWTASTPSGTSIVVETSLDGGATWQLCTNGGPIPGITPGTDVTGKTLLIRQTLTTTDPSVAPTLNGLTVTLGQFVAASAQGFDTTTATASAQRIKTGASVAVVSVYAHALGITSTYAEAVASVEFRAGGVVFRLSSATGISTSQVSVQAEKLGKPIEFSATASGVCGAVRVQSGHGAANGVSTAEAQAYRILLETLRLHAIIQPGDVVEIDTANMTVKINGVNALRFLEGDFFALAPGLNQLQYQDAEQSREVQIITRHRPRWL